MPSNEILILYLLIFQGKSEDNFRRITSSFTVSQARVSSGQQWRDVGSWRFSWRITSFLIFWGQWSAKSRRGPASVSVFGFFPRQTPFQIKLATKENKEKNGIQISKEQEFLVLKGFSFILVAIVKLQNPRLLLSCDGENIVQNCPEKIVTSYCDSTGKTKCEYLQIPYKIVS